MLAGNAFSPLQVDCIFFPLNTTNGSNALPSALTTARTVIFSRRTPQVTL